MIVDRCSTITLPTSATARYMTPHSSILKCGRWVSQYVVRVTTASPIHDTLFGSARLTITLRRVHVQCGNACERCSTVKYGSLPSAATRSRMLAFKQGDVKLAIQELTALPDPLDPRVLECMPEDVRLRPPDRIIRQGREAVIEWLQDLPRP